MNPIICATEFNKLTLEAAKTAALFAKQAGERVVLVRSVDEREQFPFSLRTRLVQQDWPGLEREARELREHGFNFELKVLRGMPEEGVAGFAWKSHARLVVVGCTPTGVVERWALGCIAEEISDTSLVPVLAVRSAAPFARWLAGDGPLNILVGFDPAARPDAVFNRLDELRAMATCMVEAAVVTYPENQTHPAEFAPPTRGEHVFRTEGGGFEATMARELAARHIEIATINPGRDMAAALVERAGETNADLLVIASHPRTDLTLLPHRSLCHDVLRRAPMNVLCVPEPDIEPPRTIAHRQEGDRADARAYQEHGPVTGSDHPVP